MKGHKENNIIKGAKKKKKKKGVDAGGSISE